MASIETQGTVLSRGDGGGPEVFAAIGEVISFQGPGGAASVIDTTNLSSAAKEKRMGLMDEGQFTFELNLDTADTMQTGLRADRTARTLRNFELALNDTATTVLSFSAYVLSFAIQGGVDAVVSASVTLEISGAVTWA